jgi:hypothetical protein
MSERLVALVLGKLERVRQNGQGWMARCPAHDDGTNSLKVDEGDDGRALVHCHAGCTQEAIVKALGLTMADLYARRNGGSPRPPAITLAELGRIKRLPLAWLEQTLGWYDMPSGGVGIPYRDETGKTLYVKRRTALKAKEGGYWPNGARLMAYGLEGLHTTEVLATLLDLARRGIAILLLNNVTKDGADFKWREEWADRVDIMYEVRDATAFTPSEKRAWWMDLPASSEAAWAERAQRRRGAVCFRLPFIPSKFRLAMEPNPFCLELHLPPEGLWTLKDVTEALIAGGQEAVQAETQAKTAAR